MYLRNLKLMLNYEVTLQLKHLDLTAVVSTLQEVVHHLSTPYNIMVST